jgi:hypothetical protein
MSAAGEGGLVMAAEVSIVYVEISRILIILPPLCPDGFHFYLCATCCVAYRLGAFFDFLVNDDLLHDTGPLGHYRLLVGFSDFDGPLLEPGDIGLIGRTIYWVALDGYALIAQSYSFFNRLFDDSGVQTYAAAFYWPLADL